MLPPTETLKGPRQRAVWHDAWDAQMGLWRWYRTPGATEWLRGLYAEGIEGAPLNFKRTMAQLYDAEQGRLIDADPFYVAGEMTELIDVARKDFKPEPLHEWDLLSPRGFLYFARPIEIGDRNGNQLTVRAFAWSQQYTTAKAGATEEETQALVDEYISRSEAGEKEYGSRYRATEMDNMVAEGFLEAHGIQIGLYSDVEDYIETSALAHSRTKGDAAYERSMSNMRRMTSGTPLVPIHIAPWQYGMTFEGNEIDATGQPTGAMEWWQLAQTTFRLMQQRRPRMGYAKPDRPSRREWARLGGRPDTEIVIVRLRREESPRQDDGDTDGEARHFSHRFIRSGHWRNQWYPSVKQHRQIYIHPTIVGDESLPLVVRPRRVFQWQR